MRNAAQKITPCLWFDAQAEEAANAYASIFRNSRIGRISRYGKEGPCGWLKDRYGVSWQIVPTVLPEMLTDADPKKNRNESRKLSCK